MKRALVAAGLLGVGVLVGPAQFDPGVGACVPLPDLPLILDWTIRALKVAIGGEIDCGL